jgi:hypothetical protein
MPDEYYVPEEVNLGPGGAKSAKIQVIRPGPGNPGLARPEQCAEGSPAGILRIPAWGRLAGRRPRGVIRLERIYNF